MSKGVKQRLIGGNKSRDFPRTFELKSLSTFATKLALMSHFNWTEASLKPGAGDQSRKTPVVKLPSWWPFFPLHPVMKLIKNETILCERQRGPVNFPHWQSPNWFFFPPSTPQAPSAIKPNEIINLSVTSRVKSYATDRWSYRCRNKIGHTGQSSQSERKSLNNLIWLT